MVEVVVVEVVVVEVVVVVVEVVVVDVFSCLEQKLFFELVKLRRYFRFG